MPYLLIAILILLPGASPAWSSVPHLDLDLTLQTEAGRMDVVAKLTLPDTADRCFLLHPQLTPELEDGELVTQGMGRYCLPAAGARFTLRYGGRIPQPPSAVSEGVYLDPGMLWYPRFDDALFTFHLRVELPAGWHGISQGERLDRRTTATGVREIWRETQPQQGLYLIATAFTEYRALHDGIEAMALLRQPDPELAQRYLDATGRYLAFYSQLLGPYPYAKFALVENFWESGYGMPSFTLLGPQVIRLPFIIHTSYPHEILHNWWGNGVYVDHAGGNWSEGLTTYLADHLLAEQQHRGVDFRRDALQRYGNFVHDGRGFALEEFQARNDPISQSVGYDKGMMLFHMLRQQLGDAVFLDGLRRFYAEHRFRRAGFGDLQTTLEAVSGLSLAAEFDQWLSREDVPALALDEVTVRAGDGDYRLSARLSQTQPGAPYQLRVPLAVQLAGHDTAWQSTVVLDRRTQRIEVNLPALPEILAMDPEFDLMRRLDPTETPASVSQLLGAARQVMVLPAAAEPERLAMYRQVAAAWAARTRAEVVLDTALERLPTDAGLWLLGWDNRFRQPLLDGLPEAMVSVDDGELRLLDEWVSPATHGLVLIGRHPGTPEQAMGLIDAVRPETLAAMLARLRHYGRYGYLVFQGEEAANILRGQWPAGDSPLRWSAAPELPWRSELAPRPALQP